MFLLKKKISNIIGLLLIVDVTKNDEFNKKTFKTNGILRTSIERL